MKLTTTLTATLTAAAFVFTACEKKAAHDHGSKPDQTPEAPGKADHADHNHADHDHSGHDHSHHDHAGHDHAHHDHSGHEHGEGCSHAKKIAGPNGGRVITAVEPHAEFFVTPDNKVRITFLNEQNQALPVAEQTVGIVCGDRSNPTTLTFTKAADNNSLLSNETLPAGNNHPTIVSFKTTPTATTVRAKFILNLTDCPTCDHKEYACTCSHGH